VSTGLIVGVEDARAVRRELEQHDRGGASKVTTATDAIRRFVADGDVIGVGGTNHARTPMALLLEILRQGRSGLSLARPLSCYECEFFIATGMAERIVTSWVGIGHGWGLARVVRDYVESARVTFEEWSHLGIGLRYKAGAMGVPFLPSVTTLGSGLGTRLGVETIECPYTGQPLAAIPALNPQVGLIHVHQSDAQGNAVIDGYQLMDADLALAARRLILSTEELVTTDELRRDPSRTVIPGFAVDAVVVQPYGAYPHECYGSYEADEDAMGEYVRAVRSEGAAGARRYVEQLTGEHVDFDSYLASIDQEKLSKLCEKARELLPR
jgi:glutaconate CoA-transferase subunit A